MFSKCRHLLTMQKKMLDFSRRYSFIIVEHRILIDKNICSIIDHFCIGKKNEYYSDIVVRLVDFYNKKNR
jgi:hypothetical protein